MRRNRLETTVVWLIVLLLTLLVGCTGPHATITQVGRTRDVASEDHWPWDYYITITPEQIEAARVARPMGHWGVPREGLQLSIHLEKEVFTNGEPIIACVTLRNVSVKLRYFLSSKYFWETDTKIVLIRSQERILGVDDPKPGESFQQRLGHIRQGPYFEEPLMPGTQRQFMRDLSKMFNLTVAGSYSAHAERPVAAVGRPYDSPTNLLSGTVTFRIVDSF